MTDAPATLRHGTTNAYDNYLCRCDACRTAKATYMREQRKTKNGAIAVKVQARAQNIALNLIRNECPDLWYEILDQAWIELTGHPARRIGRPRVSR